MVRQNKAHTDHSISTVIDDPKHSRNFKKTAILLSSFVISLYIFSSFFPASFLWGINNLTYLDPAYRIALLVISLLLLLPAFLTKYTVWMESVLLLLFSKKFIFSLFYIIIGILCGYGFYHFRISTDMYGDSRTLLTILSKTVYGISDLFNLNDYEPLTRMVNQRVARLLQIDQKLAYQIVSSACGGIFISTILFFVRSLKESALWKTLIIILFVTSGANLLFFGHVEDYTLPYICTFLYLITGWLYFDGKKTLPVLFILFLIGIRLHFQMLLFLPSLIYICLHNLSNRFPAIHPFLKPKKIVLFVLITLVLAAIAYIFYFKAYRLTSNDQTERASKIFLPMVNPLSPPHNYSLFSSNHISDVLQEFLFTLSPGTIILLALTFFFSRNIKWRDTRLVFFGISAFYFIIFNFTANPILSMARDWDLFSLAAAPLTFFGITIARQWFKLFKDFSIHKFIIGICIAPAILSCANFYINSRYDYTSRRLESIGEWSYHSYYWGASYLINVGVRAIKDTTERIARRKEIVEKLLPYKSTPDYEIACLYRKIGETYLTDKKNDLAIQYFQRTLLNDPTQIEGIKWIALAQLRLWRFDEADRTIEDYNIKVNHPAVKDFLGLLIAQETNFLRLLTLTKIDSSAVQARMDKIVSFQSPSN